MLRAWHWCGTDARRKVIGIFQQGLVRSRSYQLCLRRVVDGPSPCYSALEICLLGRCFLVRTDYRSLRHLLHQKIATPAQQLWVAKLLGYDFMVEYKTGVTNTAADSLSRQEEEGTFMAISRLSGLTPK